MAKAKRMTKGEAIREARIASSYRGGTWYVTRKRDNYGVVPADMYDSGRDGRVAETIDIHAERAARLASKPARQEVEFDLHFAIVPSTNDREAMYTISRNGRMLCAGATLKTALDGVRLALEPFDE
jgi:hypothetical protein